MSTRQSGTGKAGGSVDNRVVMIRSQIYLSGEAGKYNVDMRPVIKNSNHLQLMNGKFYQDKGHAKMVATVFTGDNSSNNGTRGGNADS